MSQTRPGRKLRQQRPKQHPERDVHTVYRQTARVGQQAQQRSRDPQGLRTTQAAGDYPRDWVRARRRVCPEYNYGRNVRRVPSGTIRLQSQGRRIRRRRQTSSSQQPQLVLRQQGQETQPAEHQYRARAVGSRSGQMRGSVQAAPYHLRYRAQDSKAAEAFCRINYIKLFVKLLCKRINMSKETLCVAFYRPESPDEPLINRATAWITGKFSHCELLFRDPRSGRQNLASSIYQSEKVFFRNKTFGRCNWTFKNIQITSKQADTMRKFCADAANKNIPFNYIGLMRCCTPFPRQTDHTCYFCSELAISAFQSADLFQCANPSVVTPSALFDMLNEFNHHATATPLLGDRIQKKGLRFKFAGQPDPATTKKKHSKLKTTWSQFSSNSGR